MLESILLREREVMNFKASWLEMKEFTECRDENTPDEIWVLQHNPVFTQGEGGVTKLLAPSNIPLEITDRGGEITYHGPGQLIIYPLVDIKRLGIGVREFVNILEQAMINWLDTVGVEAERKENAPGVYVNGMKIGSIGLRAKRGSVYHGLALNIDMDLTPFSKIDPCGMKGMKMTQVSEFNEGVNIQGAGKELAQEIIKLLEKFDV